MIYDWLETAKKLQAIAQSGLAYSTNKYDLERFEEIRKISVDIMSHFTDTPMEAVKDLFAGESGYQTPKVDIRGVIFEKNRILMVRESVDGLWSLPGGWADIGYTPGEVASKEICEESGLSARPTKLLSVLDTARHHHPPCPYHIYKIFIQCEITGGKLSPGMETTEVGFFDRYGLPPLSPGRITDDQISMLFEFHDDKDKIPVFD